MSKSVSSSVLGLFHTENKKSFLKRPLLTAGGHMLKGASQHWSPTLGVKKTPEKHLTLSAAKCNKWKAWNSLREERKRWQTIRWSWWAQLHSSFWSDSFFLYFNILPPSVNTSSMQTICRASHIYSLQHKSLLFFPFYINLTLPLLSSPSHLFLSPLPALVFCPGSYIFPCRPTCLP